MTVTAPARPRILAVLAEQPGQGAHELAATLGRDTRRVADLLRRMRNAGLVVAHELGQPRAEYPARIFFVVPEGTVPPQESPGEEEYRRRRNRINQRKRRARLAGEPVTRVLVARPAVHLPEPAPWNMPGEPACQDADPGLWFGEEDEAPQARAVRVAAAKAMCSTCPVARSCLDGALARGERFGVWGGVDLEVKGSASRDRTPKAVRPGAGTPGRT